MPRIVVLGGTGFVGRALCERLAADGDARIVVPTRRLAHGRGVQPLPTVDLLPADVHDDAQLARVVAGADAVVNLVAVLHGDEAAFERVHAALPRRLAALRPRRVVHVSALGAGVDAPSMYLRSKARGEAALAPLRPTVLRPSVLFGAEDRFLNLFAGLQAWAPVLPLGSAGARFQPAWVVDVAEAIRRCLRRPESAGVTYELAGPRVYTLAELVRLAGRWSGHERPQIALPGFAARLQALALELLPGEPLMSRDNVDSMRLPNVASGRLPGFETLGIEPAALESVAPAYLAHGPTRLDGWRADQHMRR